MRYLNFEKQTCWQYLWQNLVKADKRRFHFEWPIGLWLLVEQHKVFSSFQKSFCTGKSFSEARNICRTCCVPKLFWMSKQNKNNNLCTWYVLQVFWAYNFHKQLMYKLSTYCGLVDEKIRASDKDLPVHEAEELWYLYLYLYLISFLLTLKMNRCQQVYLL